MLTSALIRKEDQQEILKKEYQKIYRKTKNQRQNKNEYRTVMVTVKLNRWQVSNRFAVHSVFFFFKKTHTKKSADKNTHEKKYGQRKIETDGKTEMRMCSYVYGLPKNVSQAMSSTPCKRRLEHCLVHTDMLVLQRDYGAVGESVGRRFLRLAPQGINLQRRRVRRHTKLKLRTSAYILRIAHIPKKNKEE